MAAHLTRVLVCGSVEEFKEKMGDRPIEVVGQINFNDLDGNIKKLLGDKADYLIFVDMITLLDYVKKFSYHSKIKSVDTFAKKNFYINDMATFLRELLKSRKISRRVLDFDCLFGKSDWRTSDRLNVKMDCLSGNLYPITENLYRKIYSSLNECKFHYFDSIILTNERTPEEFIDVMIETEALTEEIWTFVRKNSVLERWLKANGNIFVKVDTFYRENGNWYIIKKIVPPDNVGVYIVTHKDAKLSSLPEGYKFIHAGHALSKNDFGYMGDDSGDNISNLNHFLDEVTALYWIWKNTTHTHTGFVHYRRFFTNNTKQKKREDGKYSFNANNILSTTEILKILSEYDIVVMREGMTDLTQREMIILSTGQPDLVRIVENIFRKHLTNTQPDYIDAFDEVFNGFILFPCGMHITRRNIFNSYCKWLFSFLLDVLTETLDKVRIGNKTLGEMPHRYSRVMGHFTERMLTVWLMKNHLRIKPLPIMFRENI